MARIIHDGRWALDRDGVSELTGKARATVKHWALNRQKFGYPQPCNPGQGSKELVWEDEVLRFWEAHQQAKQEALTDIDRSGDPNELVERKEVLRILQWETTARVVPPYLMQHPDEEKVFESGYRKLRWHRRTVWHYADNIRIADPAAGRPEGTPAEHRTEHPYADDPRLKTVIGMVKKAEGKADGGSTRGLGVAVARRLDVSEVTASRLIAAARKAIQ